ncbi:MAG: DUF1295 domain-containing protein [Holophagaceae bacterium]
MNTLELVLYGTLIVSTLQLGLWLYYRATDKAAWVDVGWAYGLGLIVLFYAYQGSGSLTSRLLAATMGGLWSARLGTYLFHRVKNEKEDGRYSEIKRNWKTNLPIKFFIFFQIQAGLDVILSIPFLVLAQDPQAQLRWTQWTALGMWMIAMIGEAVADHQLAQFKSEASHQGLTCRRGLWRYSRHPNYFFEWMMWIAFSLAAIQSPGGLWSLVCPALMLYFLLRVTGIPATEAQSLRSRPEDYRRYQEETSMLIPWFPKKRILP